MKICGIEGTKPTVTVNDNVYLRLCPASTYENSVAVEAVNSKGERVALICRISAEKGIERYDCVPSKVGLPLTKSGMVKTSNNPV